MQLDSVVGDVDMYGREGSFLTKEACLAGNCLGKKLEIEALNLKAVYPIPGPIFDSFHSIQLKKNMRSPSCQMSSMK